jgi:short-subunit dehydrogenase
VKVFITGASSGLGEALARRYAALGAVLGLFARRVEALRQIAASLAPAVCEVYAGDVRDPSSLRSAARDFMSRYGAPDIVIANAGVSIGTLTAHEDDNEAFRAVLDSNVVGMMQTFQPFLSALVGQKHGKLVGVASIAGFRGLPGSGAYSASKAAAISYLESLRVELSHSGVEVLTLCPGYIATPMTLQNPYPMPFLLTADKAAQLAMRAIDRGRRFYVFPWQMAWIGRALQAMPRSLFDAAFANAPRKPRGGSKGRLS